MINTDKYENWTDDFHVWEQYVKDIDYEPDRLLIADAPLLLAEVKRLREALAYTASLLTCRMEGDDIPLVHIREYALDIVDMTVDEAMATTDLMGDEEE